MFVKSIARGSNYHIRSLWINADTYNLSFQCIYMYLFFGKGGGKEGGVDFCGDRGC